MFVNVSVPASVAKSASVTAVLNCAIVPVTVFDPNAIDLFENVFVDEADYGAHRKCQFDALQTMVNDDDVLILMTGTNSDRASSEWNIDLMLSTTYF